jgi:hypothetical protein
MLAGNVCRRHQRFEPIADLQEVPFSTWCGFEDSLNIGFMPKKNRTGLKRLTSSSYSAMISAKETPAMIKNFGSMPILNFITNQPTPKGYR